MDDTEAIAEVRPLTMQEIELKNQYNAKLASILCEEELKWYQRSKAQFLLEEDSNTRYFHSIANSRYRKKLIHSLVQARARLKAMNNSSHILLIIIKVCLVIQRKAHLF
jgi:hypothetical protein